MLHGHLWASEKHSLPGVRRRLHWLKIKEQRLWETSLRVVKVKVNPNWNAYLHHVHNTSTHRLKPKKNKAWAAKFVYVSNQCPSSTLSIFFDNFSEHIEQHIEQPTSNIIDSTQNQSLQGIDSQVCKMLWQRPFTCTNHYPLTLDNCI